MFDNIIKLCKKAVIYIANIRTAAIIENRIIMLANGKIAEMGMQEKLINKKGKY